MATNQHEIVGLLIEDMQNFHALRVQDQISKAKQAAQASKRGSLKMADPRAGNLESDFEDEKPFKKMLELPNVCGHTPFFVAIVKGHLKVA